MYISAPRTSNEAITKDDLRLFRDGRQVDVSLGELPRCFGVGEKDRAVWQNALNLLHIVGMYYFVSWIAAPRKHGTSARDFGTRIARHLDFNHWRSAKTQPILPHQLLFAPDISNQTALSQNQGSISDPSETKPWLSLSLSGPSFRAASLIGSSIPPAVQQVQRLRARKSLPQHQNYETLSHRQAVSCRGRADVMRWGI